MSTVVHFPARPTKFDFPVFLGGYTAKGDWQDLVAERTKDLPITLINSSRPDWNDGKPTGEAITQHIHWELRSIFDVSKCNIIYIPAGTTSPTVMLELGMALGDIYTKTFVAVDRDYSHFEHAQIATVRSKRGEFYPDLEAAIIGFRHWFGVQD